MHHSLRSPVLLLGAAALVLVTACADTTGADEAVPDQATLQTQEDVDSSMTGPSDHHLVHISCVDDNGTWYKHVDPQSDTIRVQGNNTLHFIWTGQSDGNSPGTAMAHVTIGKNGTKELGNKNSIDFGLYTDSATEETVKVHTKNHPQGEANGEYNLGITVDGCMDPVGPRTEPSVIFKHGD